MSQPFRLGDTVALPDGPTCGSGSGTVVDLLTSESGTPSVIVYWRRARPIGDVERHAPGELVRVV